MIRLLRTTTLALLATLCCALPALAQDPYPDTIPLPNGFAPEGIARGPGRTLYAGSLAGQGVYAFDARTGEGAILVPGTPGQPLVGMKYSPRHHALFVAGGPSGRAFVFDAGDGATLATYQFAPEGTSFINDVALTPGAAYFTDSQNARLFVLPLDGSDPLPPADAFTALPLTGDWEQVEGFNANGIAAEPFRNLLYVVNTTTGALYTVDPQTGAAAAIDLGGETVTQGDGILLQGRTLYVVRNRANEIAAVLLSPDRSRGALVARLTSDALRVPTTIARFGRALYAVNARFGAEVTPATDYDAVRILP